MYYSRSGLIELGKVESFVLGAFYQLHESHQYIHAKQGNHIMDGYCELFLSVPHDQKVQITINSLFGLSFLSNFHASQRTVSVPTRGCQKTSKVISCLLVILTKTFIKFNL